MKEKLKHYSPLIITVCFIIFIIVISVLFSGYKYNSDIECINSVASGDEFFEINNVLFKFENKSKELVFYNSKDDYVIQCSLRRKEIFGKIKYKFITSSNSGLNYYIKEWQCFDKNIEYIFVKYEDDIKNIDCKGYKPVGTKINYKNGDGKETSCWIYVIDKTKQ